MASIAASSERSHISASVAEALDFFFNDAAATEIIRSALRIVGRERLAVVSSFGTESAALLKVAADVDAAIPVIFLDTGWLFRETLEYRDTLTRQLGLRDVRTITPREDLVSARDANGELWSSNPDACCDLRKVEPLARAFSPFDGWLNGRKRFQGGDRAQIPVVEFDDGRLKFNPLANVTPAALAQLYADAKLPPHPLLAHGFASVGCMPCTTRTRPGEDPRAGRWRDRGKTECGIHVAKAP
jgi:phosphoadenosine phosphosulfate reductase